MGFLSAYLGNRKYRPKHIFFYRDTYPTGKPVVTKFRPRKIVYDRKTANAIRGAYGRKDRVYVTWNGKQFDKALADLAVYSYRTFQRVVHDSMGSLSKRLMDGNPTDTGRSRAGWSAYLDSVQAKKSLSWMGGGIGWEPKGSDSAEIVRGASQSSVKFFMPKVPLGRRVIKSGRLKSLAGKRIGILLTNGVVDPKNGYPYLLALEFGRNGYSGKGFIVKSIRDEERRVKKLLRSARGRNPLAASSLYPLAASSL